MKNFITEMFPLDCALIATVLAQILKPLGYYCEHKEWKWSQFFAAGGMPSSHAAAVSSVTLAVGIVDHFSSTLFAVALVFSIVVCFDAANVRLYSGKNIAITKQLISDLDNIEGIDLTNPIYFQKMKDVLGHTYFQVFMGIVVGLLTTYFIYLYVH